MSKKWVNSSLEDAIAIFSGATASKPGQAGLVPAPAAGKTNVFLRSDGTWSSSNASHDVNILSWDNVEPVRDHQDVIDDITEDILIAKGDIAIIRDYIANNKWQYTSYVYNGSAWEAMDGNYDAENVYFSDDILVTTKVGTI